MHTSCCQLLEKCTNSFINNAHSGVTYRYYGMVCSFKKKKLKPFKIISGRRVYNESSYSAKIIQNRRKRANIKGFKSAFPFLSFKSLKNPISEILNFGHFPVQFSVVYDSNQI